MATDFWASSHHKRWIVNRATVRKAREEDRQILRYLGQDVIYLDYFAIYFANVITKLGKKLGLRQRVIATATVFFRRFYLKNSYCETDPFLVIAACCYVAAKAEESPVHIRTVMTDARTLFSQEVYNIKNFPSDNSKLAEMEFYLVDDLECDLTVFHPYRTLLTLCKKESEDSATPAEEGEAGELGSGIIGTTTFTGSNSLGVGIGADDGPRYWGTGEGQLELSAGALQTAWFIINDTYRSDICLLYPPHLIAISAIYLTFILHSGTRTIIAPLLTSTPSTPTITPPEDPKTTTPSSSKPRRSSRHINSTSISSQPTEKKPIPQQDPITFLSELNVSLPLIATISQEIISLYTLWERYKEDAQREAKDAHSEIKSTTTTTTTTPGNTTIESITPKTEPLNDQEVDNADILIDGMTETATLPERIKEITPKALSDLLVKMRVARVDVDSVVRSGHHLGTVGGNGGHGYPQGYIQGQGRVGVEGGLQVRGAVNKMLERAQNAG